MVRRSRAPRVAAPCGGPLPLHCLASMTLAARAAPSARGEDL
jgi:hypothetical protein